MFFRRDQRARDIKEEIDAHIRAKEASLIDEGVPAGEAGRAASYIFFVPLISLVIGSVYLHETLGPSLLVGAALVILGVYLVNRRPVGVVE